MLVTIRAPTPRIGSPGSTTSPEVDEAAGWRPAVAAGATGDAVGEVWTGAGAEACDGADPAGSGAVRAGAVGAVEVLPGGR